jgi:hypothetical protein
VDAAGLAGLLHAAAAAAAAAAATPPPAATADAGNSASAMRMTPPTRNELDALDEEGRSALHYAAWNGLDVPVGVLLEAGAAVDVVSGDRRSTPLHFAAGMGKLPCVRLLLEHGASRSVRDIDNWSPADLARQNINDCADWEVIARLCDDDTDNDDGEDGKAGKDGEGCMDGREQEMGAGQQGRIARGGGGVVGGAAWAAGGGVGEVAERGLGESQRAAALPSSRLSLVAEAAGGAAGAEAATHEHT